jgi:hypothetical protein
MVTPLRGEETRRSYAGPERRRHPRFCRRGVVFLAGGGASYARGQLLDLSVGGLRLSMRERLAVGMEVCLGLLLDASRGTLVVSALVQRCEETEGGFEAGLTFTSVAAETARALARFAEACSAQAARVQDRRGDGRHP